MASIPLAGNELYRVLLTFDNEEEYESFSRPTPSTPRRFIEYINLKEQNSITAGNPVGIVSPNSLSLRLFDEDNLLNPDNTSSPYYGYMRTGVKVELFYSEDNGESWNPLGIFYTESWGISLSESGFTPAELSCQDNLAYIGNMEIPPLDAYAGLNVATLLERVFEGLGLTPEDYFIDPALPTVNLLFAVTPGSKVNELLNSAAQSLLAWVNTNREGVITIAPAFPEVTIFGELELRQSETISFRHNELAVYNRVYLRYNKADNRPSDIILSLQNQVIKDGLNTFENLQANDSILSIDGVYVSFPTDTDDALGHISDVSYTASQSGITINITAELEADLVVNISVEGRTVGKTTASVKSTVKSRDPKVANVLHIENPFIQVESTAQQYADAVADYLYNMERQVEVTGLFSPVLTVGQYITVSTDESLFNGTYLITGVNLVHSPDGYYNTLTMIKLRGL